MAARRVVEILEGNDTVRRLMAETLRDLGVEIFVQETADVPPSSDLLIADVDSGIVVEERVAAYLDDDRLVLFCGLRGSRERYVDERWVDRPFTPHAFAAQCAEALGLEALDELLAPPTSTRSDGADPVAFDLDATASIKPPPSVGASTGDEPITRELEYDEAQQLEARLGLDAGALAHRDLRLSDDDAFEALDIDDSAVQVVDRLKVALGGRLSGKVQTRRVEDDELIANREEEITVRPARSQTFNQTMPDTPHALSGSDSEGQDESRDQLDTANVGSGSLSPPVRRGAAADSSAADLAPANAGGELHLQIRGVARMLAESWQRIALTSRTEDRADQIERVLAAAVGKGLRGAAEEVQRIPQASGFSGALSSLTFVEVVRTVRDRSLRGRLEVAIGDDAFVLHMDGLYLEEIDALSGNVDGLLLEILHQGGAIDDRTYAELLDAYDSGQFIGPLELELARKNVVADATLQSARVVRAREVFRRLCASRGGQFAFLEIRVGDGQPWPVDRLRINVDQLMLELLRESSIDTGDSQATASTMLQLDPNRAAAIEPGRLTDEERSVMMFFRDGDTLEAARDRLQKQAGPEDVDRIVNRLKKVELLKRSNPRIVVPANLDEKAPAVPASEADTADRKSPKRTGETVVSPVSDVMSEDERRRLIDTAEQPTDKTTSLKANWDLIPDTSELDELIDEGIAAYETEASEVHDGSESDEPS